MLKREARLLEKERQRVISQRKAQQKDQEEQRRADALNEKRQREEEEEGVRKRMRSDITMHGKRRKKSKMQVAIPKYAQGWSSVHLKYSRDISRRPSFQTSLMRRNGGGKM